MPVALENFEFIYMNSDPKDKRYPNFTKELSIDDMHGGNVHSHSPKVLDAIRCHTGQDAIDTYTLFSTNKIYYSLKISQDYELNQILQLCRQLQDERDDFKISRLNSI